MRRQPVAFALIDAAFLADSKFRGLRRRLPEPRDFNSAVGAWLIVLTSARRNGLPEVDAADEAEDTTFLPDLIAVGLLTETGLPDKPFRAWAPARPKYPSDVAPSATDVPTAPETPQLQSGVPSTPFSSHPITSPKGSREFSQTRPRQSSIDRDPELRAQRDLIRQRYGNGMDDVGLPTEKAS